MSESKPGRLMFETPEHAFGGFVDKGVHISGSTNIAGLSEVTNIEPSKGKRRTKKEKDARTLVPHVVITLDREHRVVAQKKFQKSRLITSAIRQIAETKPKEIRQIVRRLLSDCGQYAELSGTVPKYTERQAFWADVVFRRFAGATIHSGEAYPKLFLVVENSDGNGPVACSYTKSVYAPVYMRNSVNQTCLNAFAENAAAFENLSDFTMEAMTALGLTIDVWRGDESHALAFADPRYLVSRAEAISQGEPVTPKKRKRSRPRAMDAVSRYLRTPPGASLTHGAFKGESGCIPAEVERAYKLRTAFTAWLGSYPDIPRDEPVLPTKPTAENTPIELQHAMQAYCAKRMYTSETIERQNLKPIRSKGSVFILGGVYSSQEERRHDISDLSVCSGAALSVQITELDAIPEDCVSFFTKFVENLSS